MKYRTKPVVIEAQQYRSYRTLSSDFAGMAKPGSLLYTEDGTLLIATLEGTMEARDGDWIIRGVRGEFYPCKTDIFEATYEPVEEPLLNPKCGRPSSRTSPTSPQPQRRNLSMISREQMERAIKEFAANASAAAEVACDAERYLERVNYRAPTPGSAIDHIQERVKAHREYADADYMAESRAWILDLIRKDLARVYPEPMENTP